MLKWIVDLMKDEEGASMIEYVLIAALISIAGIAAMKLIGPKITSTWNTVNGALP